MLTLGIDPTSKDTMGWATVEAGGLIDFGSVAMKDSSDQSELGMLAYQADALTMLLARRQPDAVAIERAIVNSRVAARYLGAADAPAMVGRLTGAMSRSIDVSLAVGVLLHVCMLCGVPAILINPGAAKFFACGAVNAKKTTVREAARLRIYERAYQLAQQAAGVLPEFNTIKRPSEHIAAAIFIGLTGEKQRREQAMLVAA